MSTLDQGPTRMRGLVQQQFGLMPAQFAILASRWTFVHLTLRMAGTRPSCNPLCRIAPRQTGQPNSIEMDKFVFKGLINYL